MKLAPLEKAGLVALGLAGRPERAPLVQAEDPRDHPELPDNPEKRAREAPRAAEPVAAEPAAAAPTTAEPAAAGTGKGGQRPEVKQERGAAANPSRSPARPSWKEEPSR